MVFDMAEKQEECNVITYNAGISACERGAQWQLALVLLDRLNMKRLQPTLPSLNAATSACEKSGEWQAAMSLLSQMCGWHLQADLITFNAVLSACSREVQWQCALRLLDAMGSMHLGPDVFSYKAAFTAVASPHVFDLQQAIPLLSRIEAVAMNPWNKGWERVGTS